MNKTKNTLLIFLVILVQSTLAVAAGVFVLFSTTLKTVPAGIFVEGLSVGGMTYNEAIIDIEKYYEDKFGREKLLLQIENKGEYKIPFSQIDTRVDGDATIEPVRSNRGIKSIPYVLSSFFGHSKPTLQPVIKFNEGKLRIALLELSEKIYVAPKDAEISYKNGIIEKKAETNGMTLNVDNTVDVIRKQLSNDPFGNVELRCNNNFELQAVAPDIKLKDYDEIQQVFSEYSTKISDEELFASIKLATDTINGVIISGNGDAGQSGTFSFVKCLKDGNANFENDNEGFDQVASTLYAALLSSGIPFDSITRLQHRLSVDYIKPGLDSWISGTACDLKFTNTFKNKIAVFAQTEDNQVKVVIAGSITDKQEKYEIRTEIVQRYSPSVYYVENRNLKPDEKIILSSGKEGVKVNVFRNDKLLGTDEYEAEKAIVQIGPGGNWKSSDK